MAYLGIGSLIVVVGALLVIARGMWVAEAVIRNEDQWRG